MVRLAVMRHWPGCCWFSAEAHEPAPDQNQIWCRSVQTIRYGCLCQKLAWALYFFHHFSLLFPCDRQLDLVGEAFGGQVQGVAIPQDISQNIGG